MIKVINAYCLFRHASGEEVRALDDVSLAIQVSEFVCLLGRSGHGKSTLLRSLAGLNPPTTGRIEVDGAIVRAPGVRAWNGLSGRHRVPLDDRAAKH